MKLTVFVIHQQVSVFGDNVPLARPSNVAAIVKRSLRLGASRIFVKTEHGCSCQAMRLSQALKKDPFFDHVTLKGTRIEIDVDSRRRLKMF